MKKLREKQILKEDSGRNLIFSFNLIRILHAESSKEAEEFEDFYSDHEICAYEKYLYAKYMYNSGCDIKKLYCDELFTVNFHNLVIEWCNTLNRSIIRNIKSLQTNSLDKLAEKLNDMQVIQELMHKNYSKNMCTMLDHEQLTSIPEYRNALRDTFFKLLDNLKAYLKKLNPNKLQKAYYTTNLYKFFKIANITDTNAKLIAEFMIMRQVQKIKKYLVYRDESASEIFPIITGMKKFKRAETLANNGILFQSEGIDSNRSLYSDNLFILNDFIYFLCFKRIRDEEELYNICMPAIKKQRLALNDFSYIKQLPYLVNLLKNAIDTKQKGINILLYGKPGTGKTAFARVLATTISNSAYEVPSNEGFYTSALGKRTFDSEYKYSNYSRIFSFEMMRQILKKNKQSIILYDEAEDFFRKRNEVSLAKGSVNNILEDNPNPIIWTMNSINLLEESFFRRFTYILNIDELPFDIYNNIISNIAKNNGIVLSDEIKNIYTQYRPSLGMIEKSIINFALSKETDQKFLKDDLLDSLKGQNYGEELPELISNNFSFNPNLINASMNMIELIDRIKASNNLNFSLLLYGVPGSSKTSTGRYIAEQLGLKVLCRNYTELSSCWVGETEKNIKQLFLEGKRDHALIILDEADVLLQDRSKAIRSWEISQTEAFLTEMEKYPYPFILTTNLYENLDAAAMRRILYKVKYDYLTDEQIRLAFKHFFNLTLTDQIHLSKLTSGDFAVVKKQAEFEGKLLDKHWLLDRLANEMNQKKANDKNSVISF